MYFLNKQTAKVHEKIGKEETSYITTFTGGIYSYLKVEKWEQEINHSTAMLRMIKSHLTLSCSRQNTNHFLEVPLPLCWAQVLGLPFPW